MSPFIQNHIRKKSIIIFHSAYVKDFYQQQINVKTDTVNQLIIQIAKIQKNIFKI